MSEFTVCYNFLRVRVRVEPHIKLMALDGIWREIFGVDLICLGLTYIYFKYYSHIWHDFEFKKIVLSLLNIFYGSAKVFTFLHQIATSVVWQSVREKMGCLQNTRPYTYLLMTYLSIATTCPTICYANGPEMLVIFVRHYTRCMIVLIDVIEQTAYIGLLLFG